MTANPLALELERRMQALASGPGGITRENTRQMMTDFLKEKMRMKVGELDDGRIDAIAEAITSGDMMGVLRAALGGLIRAR